MLSHSRHKSLDERGGDLDDAQRAGTKPEARRP
jgi:hypothetical protein